MGGKSGNCGNRGKTQENPPCVGCANAALLQEIRLICGQRRELLRFLFQIDIQDICLYRGPFDFGRGLLTYLALGIRKGPDHVPFLKSPDALPGRKSSLLQSIVQDSGNDIHRISLSLTEYR